VSVDVTARTCRVCSKTQSTSNSSGLATTPAQRFDNRRWQVFYFGRKGILRQPFFDLHSAIDANIAAHLALFEGHPPLIVDNVCATGSGAQKTTLRVSR
jgi:hypothetical protein